MGLYTYVARDKTGKVLRGQSEAENDRILVKRLREQGYFVSMVKPVVKRPKAAAFTLFTAFQRVGLRDLSIFCRQFATMINAGVSLIRCLNVLEEQTRNARLKDIIRHILSDVEAGSSLSKALGRFPRIFTSLFTGLVRAGEVGGVLDETLLRLAGFLEKDRELRRKIKSAMTYPVLVLIFAIGVVVFIVVWVVPRFMGVYRDLEVKIEELPLPTKVMMDFTDFMTKKYFIMIGILIFLIIAIVSFGRTRIGRKIYDRIKLKAPVLGGIHHELCLARFARTLSTLLASGVHILQALETTAGTVANVIIADAIMKSRTSIREGERIAAPLEESRLFPPMVVQMVTIGEETGTLDGMLNKIADFYEAEADAKLATLTDAIQPILIVGLGGVVLFILLAVWLPLLGIISSLSAGG